MLPIVIAFLMPPCPAAVTAQPLAEPGSVRISKARVGAPPITPCVDADGHLALPALRFALGRGRLRPESAPILDALADWLHAHPTEAVRIHSHFWIGWVRGAQPFRDRAEAVRHALIRRGVQPARVSITGRDILIPDDAPGARARRMALVRRGFWFERRPFEPMARTDCGAICAQTGRCALMNGRCVATATGCRAAASCRARGACSVVGEACGPGSPTECAQSAACASRGACSLVEGRCVVVTRADCARLSRCQADHACSPVDGRCVHGDDAECAASERCRAAGECASVEGSCRPTTAAHCRHSRGCQEAGRCTRVDDRCVARSNDDCRRAAICKSRGACTPRDGQCVPRRDADCRASALCRSHGLCSYVAFNCGAASAADCADSRVCRRHGRCRPGSKGDCQQ